MFEWYEESFGEDYLLVYRHRNRQEAAGEVHKMTEWLQLPGQSHILDLCCGMGRHALTLADAGYRVTGVDLSSVLLREARAADSDKRVRWVESDMRALPDDKSFTEHFDAVVNLFTSFGYFEEDTEQLKVLRQIRKALKPGGRFVIDVLNARYTAYHLVPYSEREEQGAVISETRHIESGFVVKEIVVREPNRPARRYTERVKLYSLETMAALLNEAGLAVDNVYGSYDGDDYDARQSRRMILVGNRDKGALGFALSERRSMVL
ncbi:class I SAM-dependent methyltransferase [Cohnella sp. REN36]|uniref:class I SAM-dependent methyltransferase n=1 Tax=Cohnella sp. REN36 TaxID=2887347 RepID=UPI001D152822|nr:methyltransferase domain-containing protein [Cohnella sp. REN36]